jgi:hypothetical protein
VNGPARVEEFAWGSSPGVTRPLYAPTCYEHATRWRGAESFDRSLADFNARIHNTDMHQRTALDGIDL